MSEPIFRDGERPAWLTALIHEELEAMRLRDIQSQPLVPDNELARRIERERVEAGTGR